MIVVIYWWLLTLVIELSTLHTLVHLKPRITLWNRNYCLHFMYVETEVQRSPVICTSSPNCRYQSEDAAILTSGSVIKDHWSENHWIMLHPHAFLGYTERLGGTEHLQIIPLARTNILCFLWSSENFKVWLCDYSKAIDQTERDIYLILYWMRQVFIKLWRSVLCLL